MRLLGKDFSTAESAERMTASRFNVYEGTESPEGSQDGRPGDLFINRNGGQGITFFIKESGFDTNTGWVEQIRGWKDEQIFVSTQDQTEYTLTEFTIDADSKLTVEVNGVDQDEGGGLDWIRNTSTNKVVFNDGNSLDARVKIKLW